MTDLCSKPLPSTMVVYMKRHSYIFQAKAKYLEKIAISVNESAIASLDTVYMASTSLSTLLDDPEQVSNAGKVGTGMLSVLVWSGDARVCGLNGLNHEGWTQKL